MTQKTDPRGIVTTSYDDLNRPLSVDYSDSTPSASYAYDQGTYGIGRLSSVSSSVASTSYTYDRMGRTLQQDKTIGGISFSMSWAYNVGGLATSYTLPNGTAISQTFDNLGHPTSITSDWVDANHPATLASNFVYHPTGALTSIEYGNGTTSTRSYTSGGLLKTLQHGTPSDPGELLDFEYDYQEGLSNNGRIMGITDHNDPSKSQSYTYDSFYRLLTAETVGSHWGLNWSYDRYGNRLSQTVTKGTAPSQNLSVDAQTNRVSGWTYDEAGNTLNDGSHSYAFDANNRIASLDGGSSAYSYDASGSRVQKITGSQTTSYFFGVGEHVSGLGWSKFYIKLGQEKLVEYSGNTTRFFHADHRFTPRVRTDLSGNVDQGWDDLPFGEEWQSTGGGTDAHRFTGHLHDEESGNEHTFARHYSSQAGRWLAVDSVRGRLWKPQSLNRFSYAWNDSVNFYDPDGRTPKPYIGHWHVEVPGTIPPQGTGGGHGGGFQGEGEGGARAVAEGGYIEGVPEGEGLGGDPFDLMSAAATRLDELEDAGEITSCEALARLFDSSESIYDSRLDSIRDLMEIAGYRKGRLTEFTSTGFRPEFQQLDLDQVHHAIAAAYAGFLGGSRLGKEVADALEWLGTDSDPDYALNEVMALLGAQYGHVDSRFPFKPPYSLGLPNLYAMPNGAFGDLIRRTVCEEQ